MAFISYLTAGMQRHYPDFGAATQRYLHNLEPSKHDPVHLFNTFIGDVEAVLEEDCVIVLDDFHSVEKSLEIRQAMIAFLRNLSPLVHLVLISRTEPALPLSRLRASREVVDFREAHLAFNPKEIARFCLEVFDIHLTPGLAETVTNKLGGWVAGLVLLCHSLTGRTQQEMEENLLKVTGSQGAVLGYLEENVYSRLPPAHQSFLCKTSILSSFSPELCDQLLQRKDSAKILRYLEDHHLFTFRMDDGRARFAYHQLFREFLHSRLIQESNEESVGRLHRDAAVLLEESGREDEAVKHYQMAGEFGQAGRLLTVLGRRLFAQSRFQLLSSQLDGIPPHVLDDHPWLRYYRAQLIGLRGRHRQAVKVYQGALNGFRRQGEEEGVQSCLMELGLVYFMNAEMRKAQEMFQELLARDCHDPRTAIEALGYLGYVSSHLGDLALADRCHEQAMEVLEAVCDEDVHERCLRWIYVYRAFRYLYSNDCAVVIEIGERLKALSQAYESHRPTVGAYLLQSMANYQVGAYAEGYELAREGLSILDEVSLPDAATTLGWPSPRLSLHGGGRGFSETLRPWLIAYAAANAVELERPEQALAEAEESYKAFRKMACRTGEIYACSVLHRAHLKSGRYEAAEYYARWGVEAARGATVPRLEVMLKLDLAESLIAGRRLDEAERLLAEIPEGAGGNGATPRVKLLRACLCWANNERAKALPQLVEALESCSRSRCFAPIHAAKNWIVPLLVEAFAQGQMAAVIRELMVDMGPDCASELTRLQHGGDSATRSAARTLGRGLSKAPPSALRVYLLGKFQVYCGGKEISAKRWKSSKARTLFQFLVYSRRRGHVNKEILMELLWPEEAPALTAKRLHVALASLRLTLEPEIARGVPSSYLARMGEAYTITLGENGWVDVEALPEGLRCADKENDPEKALSHFLNAECLYRGDFLEEEPFGEWAFEPREKLRRDYLNALRRIISHYDGQGHTRRCIEYAEKYLEVDKYAEDIARTLMSYYWRAGDNLSMTRTFMKYREDIARELNCGLSEETEALYRRLASVPARSGPRRPRHSAVRCTHTSRFASTPTRNQFASERIQRRLPIYQTRIQGGFVHILAFGDQELLGKN